MSWVAIALAGAAISSIVSIFDKTVIYRYARTPHTLPLLIGIAQTSVGIVVLAIVGIPEEAAWEPVLWALLSGAVFGISAQFLMHVLFRNEVSRTIPVFQSYPIFTAIYAFFFLGEDLGVVEWLAVAVVVAGAVLMSFRPESSVRRLLLDRAFVLLMIGSAIHGSAHVFGKVAVDELPVLFTHGLRSIALGGVFFAFNLRSESVDDVRTFVRTCSPALRFVAMNELIIATAGLLLMLWALQLGPAALVTALTSARAFFLVVYSTALALVWRGALGEVTTRGVVAIKLASTALIVAGVAAIAMGSA